MVAISMTLSDLQGHAPNAGRRQRQGKP